MNKWHNAWTDCQKKEEHRKIADTEATFLMPNCKIIPILLFLLSIKGVEKAQY